jgi:predicted nucleotidyltransferase
MPIAHAELLEAVHARVRANVEAQLARENAIADTLTARNVPSVRKAIAEARNAGEVSGRVWLIGSYAWGQPDARSEIDLLMETCPNRFGMMQRIEDAVGLDVDVILVDEADPRLLPHLQREGILL